MIYSVMVSHERMPLLMASVNSYMRTASPDCVLHIVDNASEDEELIRYLRGLSEIGLCRVTFLSENKYPGIATNIGWAKAPINADLLHRSDNDVEYLPGWSGEVRRRFARESEWFGQLSMRTDPEEEFQDAVGGNCVIRRSVFSAGLRYPSEGWETTPWEDGAFNMDLRKKGFRWGRVEQPCIVHIGDKMLPHIDLDDPYYERTYRVRGISSILEKAKRVKV